ncbi:MAG: alcohol dehydrogenase catalytic domain-containing protein [Zestosphaera sp.]
MKACLFKEAYKVASEEVPTPKLADDSVLVNVKVAGICGSDLEVYRGRRNVRTPIIMGHEAAGVVAEVGRNVKGFSVGDRVVIEPNVYCGNCYYCRKGRMDICENKIVYGITRDGVFAEYVDVPSKFAWKIPDGVPYEVAVLADPLGVVLRALRHTSLLPSDNVLVVGGGPIGALTALTLQYMSVNVVVTEVVQPRIELLKDIGVRKVVDVSKSDADDAVKHYFEGSKADYVIDAVATNESFAQAFRWLRPGGKIVVLGLLSHRAEVEVYPLVRGTLNVEGSVIYLGDYIDALRLMRREDFSRELLKLITHKFKLDECGKAFEVAASGKSLKVLFEV